LQQITAKEWDHRSRILSVSFGLERMSKLRSDFLRLTCLEKCLCLLPRLAQGNIAPQIPICSHDSIQAFSILRSTQMNAPPVTEERSQCRSSVSREGLNCRNVFQLHNVTLNVCQPFVSSQTETLLTQCQPLPIHSAH
jgi:hypothetical protein